MLRTRLPLLTIPLVLGFLAGCSDDPTDPVNNDLQVPEVYSFESRFETGASSVEYPGQTVRNLLMQDIRSLAASAGSGTAVSAEDFLELYEYSDASALSTTTSSGTLPALETGYSSISTGKNISGKVAPGTLIGSGMTADQMIRSWFDSIEVFSADPDRRGTPMAYTTADGLDLVQLLDKVMLGSVAYYQGTSYYLNNVLEAGNSEAHGDGNPFTEMEHAWDEAFGYFGAARDYDRYTDAMLAGSTDDYVFDSNGDGEIDFQSEYNFPFARNAGKRDAGATSGVDFSGDIFEAFRRGRALISSAGSTEELAAERQKVARIWEKVVASTVIHYINEVLSDMEGLSETSTVESMTDLNKHWGEMKGYLWALQFNSLGVITTADLEDWHAKVGPAPVYAQAGSAAYNEYRTDLTAVRDALGARVGFGTADVAAW